MRWQAEIRIETFGDGGVDGCGLRGVELLDVRSDSVFHDRIDVDVGVIVELRVSQCGSLGVGTD